MFSMIKSISSFIIIISPLLIGSANNELSIIAKLILYGYSLFLIFYAGMNFKIFKIKLDFNALLVAIFAIYLVLRSSSMHGLMMALQFIIILVIFVIYKGRTLPIISFEPRFMFLIALLFSLLELLNPGLVFANKNYWSVMLLLYMVPCLFFVKNYYLLFLLSILFLLFVILSGSRAVLVSVVVSYIIVFWFVSVKFSYKKIIKIFFLVVFTWVLLIFLQSVYQNIDYYNSLFLELTGKRLESGRIEIWTTLINHLALLDVFFGKGGGVDVESVINEKLSAHSNYVYLLFAYGAAGLILFLSVCTLSLSYLKREKMYISLFFSVALLFRDFFEVSLVHNNYPIAFFFWVVFFTSALELNLIKYNEKKHT